MKLSLTARLAGLAAALGLFAALVPGTAGAQTATGTLTVNANVIENCTLSNATLAFGAYDPIVANLSSPLNGSTTTTLTCTNGSPANVFIGMNAGQNGGSPGCTTTRAMKNGTNFLCYDLYEVSPATTIWPAPPGLSESPTGGTATPTTVNIYGQIPAGQNATYAATNYTDSVTMTVSF